MKAAVKQHNTHNDSPNIFTTFNYFACFHNVCKDFGYPWDCHPENEPPGSWQPAPRVPALRCRNRNLSRGVEKSLLLPADISQVNSHGGPGGREDTRQCVRCSSSVLSALNSETEYGEDGSDGLSECFCVRGITRNGLCLLCIAVSDREY